MQMKGMQKMISLWLVLCLVVSMVPVPTFAEETAAETAVTETTVAAAETTLPTEVTEETTAPAEMTEENTVPTETEAETTATEEPTVPETETLTVTDEAVGAEVTASGTCGENLMWVLENGVLTITGEGAMENYNYKEAPWYENRDDIYEIVFDDRITGIGNCAFTDCALLTDINLPASLKIVGESSFEGCDGVTELVIPEGVISIGKYAFGCGSLTTVNLPSTITSVDDCAFYCWNISKIYISNMDVWHKNTLGTKFSSEEYELYVNNELLTEYVIPATLTSIAPWEFCNCISIKSLTIPSGVTSIGRGAFKNCRNLTRINIPTSLSTIQKDTFLNCAGLESIDIPSSVTEIGTSAFENCSKLQSVSIQGTVSIGDSAFLNCNGIQKLNIIGVTGIGSKAFQGCSGLISANIQNGAGSIGGYAFKNCSSLKTITLPLGITQLGFQSFAYCGSLESITIPPNVTWIDDSAFRGCNSLLSMTFLGNAPDLHEWALWELNTTAYYPAGNATWTDSKLKAYGGEIVWVPSTEIPTGNICGENLTWELGADGTLTISGTGEMTNWTGAASVPWNAVASSITGVVVESGVTSIGTYAFSGCTALADVTLPDTLEKIGHSAFAGCSQLTGIVIPNGVTSIEKSTFSDCSALVDVTIPSGVSSIGASAFYHCENLTDILIPDGVTEIDSFAFDHCTNLKTVLLPNTLKTIGSYAFRDCVSLANFRIPEGTKTLNNGAFLGCKALKSIIIPETVTSLGDNVFTQCSGLTSVVISAKVKELPLGLFEDCEDLTTITLPVTLTAVKDNAFNGCNDLKCVYYGGTKQQWDAFVPSKVGTGNEPLLDSDLQLRCQEYSPEIALLEEYAEDWYVKYEEYMRAVITVLNELPEDIEESRSEQIRKSAERMKNHDKKSDDKYIVFTYSIPNMAFCPEEYKDACYLALAEALYDNLAEHIDFSKIDFSEYTDGGITNIVAKNIVNVNQEYSYDGITVIIKIVGFGQTMNGSLYCTVNSMGKAPYEAMLKCPQEMYLEEMENLCKELSELGVASVDYGYAAFAEDILTGALHEMNEAKLQEKLGSTADGILKDAEEEFISYGTGKFIDAVKSCNRYFTFLVKPIQDGNSADLIRETNLYGVAGIDFESFYDLSEYELEGLKVDSRVSKALNNLEKASEKLEKATEEYLNGELSASSKFSWKSFFNCPVSVSIFDSAGTQIGYVGEDDIWYHDNIIIEETAGAKIISSLTDEIPSFRIAATDYGTMSCSFEEYDEAGLPVGRLNFYDIPLAPNQIFQVELQKDLENNQNGIQVKTAGTDHNCSEYIPATEDAAVTILGTAVADDGTAGGTVNGGGICTRGDAAILLAVPEIGYSFNGWYQENILISLNAVYEFTAKEDVVLTAKFRKNDELQVCVVAETGGCVFGNGRFSRGDTAEVLAVAQSGYQFTGWYQDSVLVSDKDNYSFNVTENVTLIAKFEKSANLTKTVPMHRMYDPNSGEHFYSGSELERDFLVEAGWHYEGVGFNFPEEGAPVHRLYDPVHGEHLYTMDEAEMNKLLDEGWQYEGVAFNSAGTDEVPQYRLHNPNAKRGGYHFTGSDVERDFLISLGWILQGIGWYSCVD